MELIKKYQGYIAIGIAAIGLVGLVALSSNDKSADTDKTEDADKKTTQTDEKSAAKQDDKLATAYNYTAQPGDSYTVLARKAVQTYGINEKVTLSPAQIVAAETQLAANAGFIELNEGQTVAIAKSAVKAAVDSAKKLGADVLAAWAVYVPSVDFDTRAAGQAQTK